jgi:hypothetical protein
MAIYHFSAKVIGRGTGRSAVAAAAYRSASHLHDERLGRHHDFTNTPNQCVIVRRTQWSKSSVRHVRRIASVPETLLMNGG